MQNLTKNLIFLSKSEWLEITGLFSGKVVLFRRASSVALWMVGVGLLVGRFTTGAGLKYLNNYWMNGHEILRCFFV